MKVKRFLSLGLSGAFAIGAVALLVRAQTTSSAVKISPEAKLLLDEVAKAYSTAKSLDLAGEISLQFEGAGKVDTKHSAFTSFYSAPNQFRHDLKDDLTIVSTGEKLTIYSTMLNQFIAADLKKNEKLGDDGAPPVLFSMLGKQNPSLLAAVRKDPIDALIAGATEVNVGSDVTLDGKPFAALELAKSGIRVSILIDKTSHLLRRVTVDMREKFASQVPDLKTATVTIDYSRAEADTAVKPEAFAYEVPKDAKPVEVDMPDNGEYNARAMALIGKPAPELKLKDLSGADVDLSALKGHVVVLDFWATWCGPCKASLPGYSRLAKEYADSGGAVKMFAVNLAEPPIKVRQYLEGEGLTVPTLLDTRGEVGERFGAEAIPCTFVIRKDGIVANVFTGASEEQIVQAIALANR